MFINAAVKEVLPSLKSYKIYLLLELGAKKIRDV